MDHQPLVSVIIIFLNEEKFIAEAIDSVFAQNYDHWELLLVNDGSTDNSTNIALNYAQKNPQQVRYLEHSNHENCGMSASRNLGIEHAKGEFIAFLDADDIWLPGKLTDQLAIFESYPEVAMVYGWVQFWHSWTGKQEDIHRDYFVSLGVEQNSIIHTPNLLPILWKQGKQKPVPSNVMVHREILIQVGKSEVQFRGWAEDTVLFTKIGLNFPIYVSQICWVKHRENQNYDPVHDIFIAARDNQRYLENQAYFNWTEQYLIAQGMKNSQIWKELKKARLVYDYPFLHYLFQGGFADLLMNIGRRALPQVIRDWLWIHIGKKIYNHS
jgi:glycosyltransferase involved in cell wall biosynthesis